MRSKVLILNGPNLNMLGLRQPEIYGAETLKDVQANCLTRAQALGLETDFRQSNLEGELVTWIQESRTNHDAIIINAGAYTHTSVAIMDALLVSELPVVEVHISNIHQREEFRHQSYISKVAYGIVVGFGTLGYEMALESLAQKLKSTQKA
ncbi:MAG: type II 3-dehydroquinate dehydratase [Rhodospirillales bacterium]|nr:type II 3-dehydroquinate dehydratase [Rhodospirillales bacterium]